MTRGTVLAVDDNPDNLVLLAGILERAGYDVRAANSGRRALSMAEREKPELILLDVEMPEMNGYDVCTAVKARADLGNVPVIFLSAHHEVGDKLQGFAAGGVDYIAKPFDEAEVLARVDTQLKLHRLQREVEERNRELLAMNHRLRLENERTSEAFYAVSELLPGVMLDEGYRVDEQIGAGGFGAVYRGEDLRLRRPVAIKVLRPSGGGRKALERFHTEGIAACRVRHPNAVEVLAAGTARGVAYLVMELLEGAPLSSLMTTGPVPAARAIAIAAQVADALTAAHAARVIHRDITPNNIFLHTSGGTEIVKVLDFGIARLVDDDAAELLGGVTATTEFVGTPEYMPPERLLGGVYDASADVYSLGVVLFRMITAKSLFATQTRFDMPEMVRLHLQEKPRKLAGVADVPEHLAQLVDGMLAKDPAERPTSREVASALREIS